MSTIDQVMSITVKEIELDVTGAAPVGEPCVVSCSLFVPDDLPEHPTVVVAVPGGTYTRRYYDLQPYGRAGYSQARHFAQRGVIFAAVDYLTGGDSTRPTEGDAITMAVLADAAHAAFERLRTGLRDGSFGTGPIHDARFVGLGFSFGGSVTVVQQGKYDDYAGMAIVGFSPLGNDNLLEVPEDWDSLSEAERRAIVWAYNTEAIGAELAMYHGMSRRGPVGEKFYLPDTADELIRYDEEEIQTVVPRMAGIDAMTPDYCRGHGERIGCPVFLAFGDVDIVADPWVQPKAYPGSRDITLTVIPRMAHIYNLMETRQWLWDRMLLWLDDLERLPG